MKPLARISLGDEHLRPKEGGAADVLRAQIKAAGTARPGPEVRKREALLLLLDSSGSMGFGDEPTAWEELLTAVHALTSVSDPAICSLGAAVFTSEADMVGAFTTDFSRVEAVLEEIEPTGGTGMVEALTLAREIEWPQGTTRRVVLLSDGMPTTGSPLGAARKLGALGVTIDTVGCGPGADEETLRAIAAAGKGVYVHCGQVTELRAVFKRLETKARGLLGSGG